ITEGWMSLEQGVARVLRTRPRIYPVDLKWSVLQRLQHAEPLGVAVDAVLKKLARDGSLFQPLERSLRLRGWLLSLRRTAVIQGLSLGVWGMVWSIGTWRLLAGMEAERPVAFLLSVQFSLGVVIVNLLLNPPRLSHPAQRLLERRSLSCQDTNGCDTGAQMLAAFALIGTAALPPAVAATLPAAWSPCSSSSSSSSSSDAAVGAGCGSGGCGGCGGCGG
ncbi:MAG: TIGR04222 domain-containing membrane protein, partial [Synechococcaceae cyanobacterium]|nr:TIGR04222 domain-containing membrane protein [Synechococcaceae cyanobacterium]